MLCCCALMVPSAKGSFEMLCGRCSLLPSSYLLPVAQLCGLTPIIFKVFFDILCHEARQGSVGQFFCSMWHQWGLGWSLAGSWPGLEGPD